MKNLFEVARAEELKERIARLSTGNKAEWGKMNVAQALAHCSLGMEWSMGDRHPPRMLVGRALGWIVKSRVMGDDQPLRRNTPTAKDLVIADERDLAREKDRLIGLIDRFVQGGPGGCTEHPHSFFGRLTPDQWAILGYKHLDHHLRQFGG